MHTHWGENIKKLGPVGSEARQKPQAHTLIWLCTVKETLVSALPSSLWAHNTAAEIKLCSNVRGSTAGTGQPMCVCSSDVCECWQAAIFLLSPHNCHFRSANRMLHTCQRVSLSVCDCARVYWHVPVYFPVLCRREPLWVVCRKLDVDARHQTNVTEQTAQGSPRSPRFKPCS